MPCQDYGRYSESETERVLSNDKKGLKQKVDKLTSLLCEACNYIDNSIGAVAACSEELQNWWAEHQKVDEERRKKETKRLLSRLSDEEKELLKKHFASR